MATEGDIAFTFPGGRIVHELFERRSEGDLQGNLFGIHVIGTEPGSEISAYLRLKVAKAYQQVLTIRPFLLQSTYRTLRKAVRSGFIARQI